MEYLYRKSFSVGGYGKEYSNNWDNVFGKKGGDQDPAGETTRATFGDPELDALAERARAVYAAATPEQRAAWDRAQRISFVYGNLRLDGVEVTEEQVAAAVDALAARTCSRARADDGPCDGPVVREGLCRLHLDVEIQKVKTTIEALGQEHVAVLRDIDERRDMLARLEGAG